LPRLPATVSIISRALGTVKSRKQVFFLPSRLLSCSLTSLHTLFALIFSCFFFYALILLFRLARLPWLQLPLYLLPLPSSGLLPGWISPARGFRLPGGGWQCLRRK